MTRRWLTSKTTLGWLEDDGTAAIDLMGRSDREEALSAIHMGGAFDYPVPDRNLTLSEMLSMPPEPAIKDIVLDVFASDGGFTPIWGWFGQKTRKGRLVGSLMSDQPVATYVAVCGPLGRLRTSGFVGFSIEFRGLVS